MVRKKEDIGQQTEENAEDLSKNIISIERKKSELRASGNYDLERLRLDTEYFLKMEYEEKEESILFAYDRHGLESFKNIRQEEPVTILNILLLASGLERLYDDYTFSIQPANLWYNSAGKIRVMERDLPQEEQQNNFANAYKALIGCALTGKYTFRDYLEGGSDLYGKSDWTKGLAEIEATAEIVSYLENKKKNYLSVQKKETVRVSRKKHGFLRIASVIFLVFALVTGVYAGIQYFYTIPYLNAVSSADRAYIANDLNGVIKAMEKIEPERMEKTQKYTLALAYLSSESMTDKQKQMISGKINLQSDDRYLEYWIAIGRLKVEDAENLAMSLSDDELLLYAYLTDKEQTENDSKITGEEKKERIDSLNSQIESLYKKISPEEE